MDNIHVLIVDDDPIICQWLNDELNDLGYSCSFALDGQAALGKLAETNYEIALVDIKLPSGSGMDLLKAILSKYHTTVIMITAIDDAVTAVKAIKLGAVDYVVKPFDINVINSSISLALEEEKNFVKDEASKVKGQKEFKELNAIARGIELNLDSLDKRAEIAVELAIKTARELGLEEEKISEWALLRKREQSKGKIAVNKFNQSEMTFMMLPGMKRKRMPQRKTQQATIR